MNRWILNTLLVIFWIVLWVVSTNLYYSSTVKQFNTSKNIEKIQNDISVNLSIKKVKEICDSIEKWLSKDDFLAKWFWAKLSTSTFGSESYIIWDTAIAICSVNFTNWVVDWKAFVANN